MHRDRVLIKQEVNTYGRRFYEIFFSANRNLKQ